MSTFYAVVNADVLPDGQAHLPLDDRGLRYGDGVFTTTRVTADGSIWQAQAHWQRLHEDAAQIGIPLTASACEEAAHRLLRANAGHGASVLRMQVTRGQGGRGYLPAAEMSPNLFAQLLPMPARPDAMSLVLSRWRRPALDVLPPVKLTSALNLIMARMEVASHPMPCDALMLSAQAEIAETTSYSILWRRGEEYFAPSAATGAIRSIAMQTASQHLPICMGGYPLEHLLSADAVCLLNSVHGAVAVRELVEYHTPWHAQSQRLAAMLAEMLAG